MKKLLLSFTAVSLLYIFAFAGDGKSKWDLFSENMKSSLQNNNPGVRLGALKLIIRHSDKLNTTDPFFNIVKDLNESQDPKIRKAALIALYKLDPAASIEFFERRQTQEKDKIIRVKMAAIVTAYQKNIAQADYEINNCFKVCGCCNFVNITY